MKILLNGQKPGNPQELLKLPQDLINYLQKTWPSFELAELNWHTFIDHPDWETPPYTIFVLRIKHNEPKINTIYLQKAIQAWIRDQDKLDITLALYDYSDKAIDLIFYSQL